MERRNRGIRTAAFAGEIEMNRSELQKTVPDPKAAMEKSDEHPVAGAAGAVAGAAVGAVGGALGGPAGMAAGAVAGGVLGGVTGGATGERIDRAAGAASGPNDEKERAEGDRVGEKNQVTRPGAALG